MVVRQAEATGADADVLRLAEPFHDKQVRRRMRFPHHGVVLTDPELLEPELVGPDDVLQVPLVAVLETALRRMTGHREYAELHVFPFTVQVVVAPRSGNDARVREMQTAFCTACVASALPPAFGGRGRIEAATVRLLPCFTAAIYIKDGDRSTLGRIADVEDVPRLEGFPSALVLQL